jgi:mannose/fructose/N-acetylgalactosamine-specific phosphotransferase system component IIC
VSLSLLLTGLLGGCLAADATALAQLLISQPLVGGALTGLIWGEPVLCTKVGAMLQLFALTRPPVGGRTPEDFASAGVAGPAVAVLLERSLAYSTESAILVSAVVTGLAVALAGRPLIGWLRLRNEALVRWSETEVRAGRAGALDLTHWLGVLHAFALGTAVTLAGIGAGTAVAGWALSFDAVSVGRAARLAEPVLWGLGAGLAARQFVNFRRGSGAVFLGILAVLLAMRLAGSQ